MSTSWSQTFGDVSGTILYMTDEPDQYPADDADEPVTLLGRLIRDCGVTLDWVGQQAGTTKQQISKLKSGERRMTAEWAQRLAPVFDMEWVPFLEGHLTKEVTPPVKLRVAITKPPPVRGEPLEDSDELALIAFWRTLTRIKRYAAADRLGVDLPSMRDDY